MSMPTAAEIFGAEPPAYISDGAPRVFERVDDEGYRLSLPTLGLSFDLSHLRREHGALVGELLVRADLAGARTVEGVLSAADFSVSSLRARQERARYLRDRAQADDIDWPGLLEELCLRVLAAERAGQPALSLRDLPRPGPDEQFEVEGVRLLARHPVIWFGDGGAAKSYLALFVAGRLAQRGVRVALLDWELAGEDHRDRLERLFGTDMPDVTYVRCDRPLSVEVDRLRRIARDQDIAYAIYDSVAFACDGPPEAAEVAARYFQAVRRIGVGSLHIAHVSKAGEGAEQKPFGSTFWHNGARATYFIRLAEAVPGEAAIRVGVFPRKANLGALPRPVGFEVRFGGDRTDFLRIDPADDPDLAVRLPLWQRMARSLRRGPAGVPELADELEVPESSIRTTLARKRQLFGRRPDGRVVLLERRGR